jgi:hypothetical protein
LERPSARFVAQSHALYGKLCPIPVLYGVYHCLTVVTSYCALERLT